jgi:multisubunit Na+/H+ antiporter MnhG subunit
MKYMSRKLEIFFEKVVNSSLYLLTLGTEATIIYRFYLSQSDKWSLDLILQLLVIAFMTPLVFICLWRASNLDCGRLPKEDIDRELDTRNY